MKKLALLLLLLPCRLFAQPESRPQAAYGRGATVPSSCTAPSLFYKTSATQGLYHCVAGVYIALGAAGGGPVGGSGTVNRIPKFTAGTTLGNTPFSNTTSDLSLGAGTDLRFSGTTSGTLVLAPPAIISSHTLTLPSAAGAANTFLQTDNSGVLSWPSGFTFNNSTRTASVIGSANTLNIAGSATTAPVTLAATGTDASVPIKIAPKGDAGFIQVGADTYGASGWAGYDIGVEMYDLATKTGNSYGIYVERYVKDVASARINGIQVTTNTQNAGAVNNLTANHSANFQAISSLPTGKTIDDIIGVNASGSVAGAGVATAVTGIRSQVDAANGGSIGTAYGVQSYMYDTVTTPNTGKQYAFAAYRNAVGVANSEAYSFWASDLTGAAVNPYFLWYDSPGVWRVNGAGVMAYYNPSFTKYTPGAANYERIVQQWNSNAAEIGTEAGGTGTLRQLNFIGSGFGWKGTTSGVLTHAVPATVTSYTLTWPSAQASGTKVLQNDGSGNLSWATAAGVGGSGTTNQIPLFTAGTTLGDSILTQGTNLIEQKNSTNAQTFKVYRSTDATLGQTIGFDTGTANQMKIVADRVSGSGTYPSMEFVTNNTLRLTWTGSEFGPIGGVKPSLGGTGRFSSAYIGADGGVLDFSTLTLAQATSPANGLKIGPFDYNAIMFTGMTGSDSSANPVRIIPGPSTGASTVETYVALKGTAAGSYTTFQQHTLIDRFIPGVVKRGLTAGSANSLFEIALPTGTTAGGTVEFTVHSDNGTDFQSDSGEFRFDAVNKAGTITSACSSAIIGEVGVATSGTISVACAVSNGASKITIQITPTITVITPTTLRVTYSLTNQSQQEVTIL